MVLRPNLAALAALFLFTATASAADFPKGTFAATQAGADFSIQFDGEGMFTVTRDGEVIVEGKYKAAKDEIELTDEKGPRANPSGKPGKYTWKLDGKKLTFTKVEDDAGGRAQALTHGDWTLKD